MPVRKKSVIFASSKERNRIMKTQETEKIAKRLVKAIESGRFNHTKYLNGKTYYGHLVKTMPVFCSYGQIGFSATIDNATTISYDWEFKKITIE